jgi:hypothetical protein
MRIENINLVINNVLIVDLNDKWFYTENRNKNENNIYIIYKETKK